eukprot:3922358-Prymnesium_polylepis.1
MHDHPTCPVVVSCAYDFSFWPFEIPGRSTYLHVGSDAQRAGLEWSSIAYDEGGVGGARMTWS